MHLVAIQQNLAKMLHTWLPLYPLTQLGKIENSINTTGYLYPSFFHLKIVESIFNYTKSNLLVGTNFLMRNLEFTFIGAKSKCTIS